MTIRFISASVRLICSALLIVKVIFVITVFFSFFYVFLPCWWIKMMIRTYSEYSRTTNKTRPTSISAVLASSATRQRLRTPRSLSQMDSRTTRPSFLWALTPSHGRLQCRTCWAAIFSSIFISSAWDYNANNNNNNNNDNNGQGCNQKFNLGGEFPPPFHLFPSFVFPLFSLPQSGPQIQLKYLEECC